MKLAQVTGWVEQHPTESIVIGAGGVIAILWLLGYFGSSAGASSSGASNLASAYYAAEAQQAVVGGEIQMTTLQTAAATAQNAAQVNGAVAIAKAQAKAATTINGQNASSATTIATDASDNALLATRSNNATALATTLSNNATKVTIDANDNQTSLLQTVLGSIIPAEMPYLGGGAVFQSSFGNIGVGAGSLGVSPNDLIARGYTQQKAFQIAGVA